MIASHFLQRCASSKLQVCIGKSAGRGPSKFADALLEQQGRCGRGKESVWGRCNNDCYSEQVSAVSLQSVERGVVISLPACQSVCPEDFAPKGRTDARCEDSQLNGLECSMASSTRVSVNVADTTSKSECYDALAHASGTLLET